MAITAAEVRDAFKYLFPDELPALKELVSWLPPAPTVINIGAGAGTSGLAIMETRPDVTLLTVDITNASSPLGCLEAERDVLHRAGFANQWGIRWFQFHGTSENALRSLHHNPSLATLSGEFSMWDHADMIFIDGEHSYEGCKSDIENSLPLLGKGGILAVHDYLKESISPNPNGPHPKEWPGVTQAVREILYNNPIVEVCLHVDSLIAFRRIQHDDD